MSDKLHNKKKLILSGGGVKGLATLGALKALFEYDPNFYNNIDTIAGSSVGSVIATLLLLDYTVTDLFDFVTVLDFTRLRPNNFKSSKISLTNILDNLINKYGFDDGENIMMVIKKLFQQKNIKINITFKELYEKTNKNLIITATCINSKKVHYFSIDTPDMEILLAVRMSISIPVYFIPVKHNHNYYVDGSCIDNYPIQLFEENLNEVIGIYLSDATKVVTSINNMEDYLINTFKSLLEGINCNALKGYEKYSIKISIEEINIMNLNLDQNKKLEIFNTGYVSAKSFLSI